METKRFIDEFAKSDEPKLLKEVDDYDEFPNKVLLDELRNKIIQNIIDNKNKTSEDMKNFIKDEIDKSVEGYDLSNEELSYIYNLIDNEVNGYGPLTELLKDKELTEIMVNSPNEIYIELDGKVIKDDSISFINNDHIVRVVQRLIQPIGKTIDIAHPMVDARLDDGSRLNAILPPLSLNGPVVTIRKFKSELANIEDLLTFDSMKEGAFSKRISNVKPTCWFDYDEQMKRSYCIFLRQTMSGDQVIENLLEYAGHPAIQFDLSVLWSGLGKGEWDQAAYALVQLRFNHLKLLYTCLTDENNQWSVLSNFYRLYRFLCGWNAGVGHIYYHTWDASGFCFGQYSYSDVYTKEYKDERFIRLLNSPDILSSLEDLIKEQYSESDIAMSRDTFSPERYLRIWLLLKVLIANESKEKITYWADRAIGCYNGADDNRINENHEFSISNSCAGYIYRDGVRYADKNGHLNPVLLDRPLYAPDRIADYDNFRHRQVAEDILQSSDEYIKMIFKNFVVK